MANLGADAAKKVVGEKGGNNERWKVVQGCWDGSDKKDGSSRCGVVIKGVNREKLDHDQQGCGTTGHVRRSQALCFPSN